MTSSGSYTGTYLSAAQTSMQDLNSGHVDRVLRALGLLDAIWPHLRNGMEQASERGRNTGSLEAWELARDYVISLEEYFVLRPRLWSELADWSEIGQAACRALGDTSGLAATHRLRGKAVAELGEPGEALQEFDKGLQRAVDLEGEDRLRQLARLYRDKARCYCLEPNLDFALRQVELGLSITIDARDLRRETAEILNIKGNIHRSRYRYKPEMDESLACFQEARAIFQDIGHEVLAARAGGNIGLIHKDRGSYEQARVCFEEALGVYQRLGEKDTIARLSNNLGTVCYYLENYPAAIDAYTDSLEVFRQLDLRVDRRVEIARQLLNLTQAYLKLGDERQAVRRLEEAESILEKVSDVASQANAYRLRAELCLIQEDTEQALSLVERAMSLAQDLDLSFQADFHTTLAQVHEARGEKNRAQEEWQWLLGIYRDELGNRFLAAKAEAKLSDLSREISDADVPVNASTPQTLNPTEQELLKEKQVTTPDSPKTHLTRVLAQLYYRDPDIERIVSTTGLDLSMIAWDERPVNTWRSVLEVGEGQGRVESLFAVVSQEKGSNESLSGAIATYRQSKRPPPSPAPTPPTPLEPSASVRHLKTRLSELQRRFDTLTKRIAALDTDIGRALQSLDKQVLEERRADLVLERDQTTAEMENIERQLANRDVLPT